MDRMDRHGHTKHGVKTPTYRVWCDMRRRCFSPAHKEFSRYGGRGITVCSRWEQYPMFLIDMGEKPNGMTIERINNNGNYEPSNCRWATRKEQNLNTRRTRMIEYEGERLCIRDWERRLGLGYGTVHRRLAAGLTIEHALSPVRGK